MNTELLRRILDNARLSASPSEADDIRMILVDLDSLEAITEELCLDEIPAQLKALADVRAHIAAQPFDIDHDAPEEGVSTVTDLTPNAFNGWMGDLEYIAS